MQLPDMRNVMHNFVRHPAFLVLGREGVGEVTPDRPEKSAGRSAKIFGGFFVFFNAGLLVSQLRLRQPYSLPGKVSRMPIAAHPDVAKRRPLGYSTPESAKDSPLIRIPSLVAFARSAYASVANSCSCSSASSSSVAFPPRTDGS